MLDLALREASVPRSEAVLIGGSVTDVLAAKAAGTACIGYRPAAEDPADLVDAGADCTVTSINEITQALMASPATEAEPT